MGSHSQLVVSGTLLYPSSLYPEATVYVSLIVLHLFIYYCISVHKIWCNIKTWHAIGSFFPTKRGLFFILQFQASWCVWPPAQLLLFKFLPAERRFRYLAGVTFCWNFFLSWYTHKVSSFLAFLRQSLKYFDTLLVIIG